MGNYKFLIKNILLKEMGQDDKIQRLYDWYYNWRRRLKKSIDEKDYCYILDRQFSTGLIILTNMNKIGAENFVEEKKELITILKKIDLLRKNIDNLL
jgi:hypothetical protein